MGDEENEELDDIYDDRDDDEYGEEAEMAEEIQFRGSGYGMSNGFSNLDIIQETPDDEQLESVSKSKSKSAHSSPPQTKSTGDHRESTKAADLEQRNPK